MNDAMQVHDRVRAVVDAYLAIVDREAPNLVEGLCLTGSTALGDFRPHTSDVDFLAVTRRAPDAAAAWALTRTHARLRKRWPRPFFEGLYTTWDKLARDPSESAQGPHHHEGRLRVGGRGDCNPVTWQTVASHGVACRGPAPRDIAIWTAPDALVWWTLNNFDTYWQPLLRHARSFRHPPRRPRARGRDERVLRDDRRPASQSGRRRLAVFNTCRQTPRYSGVRRHGHRRRQIPCNAIRSSMSSTHRSAR